MALLTSCYCTDSGPDWHHQCKWKKVAMSMFFIQPMNPKQRWETPAVLHDNTWTNIPMINATNRPPAITRPATARPPATTGPATSGPVTTRLAPGQASYPANHQPLNWTMVFLLILLHAFSLWDLQPCNQPSLGSPTNNFLLDTNYGSTFHNVQFPIHLAQDLNSIVAKQKWFATTYVW